MQVEIWNLCCYEAKTLALQVSYWYDSQSRSTDRLLANICDHVFAADITMPVPILKMEELTNGQMADVTINNVNIPDTEMTTFFVQKIQVLFTFLNGYKLLPKLRG